MAWYRTGTITVTNGSTTVTGSGTAWIANAGVGEALYAPDGRLYEIASISSNTTFVLGSPYLGSTASAQPYVLVPSQSYIRDLAAQAADLVNNYSTIYNTVGQGKFADGTLANPGIRFSDDLDTGFYRSASNEVTFVAGGVAQFKYNTSGLQFTGAGSLVNLTTTGNTTLGDAAADTVTINGTPTINAPTVITTSSTTNALRITQTGTGNALLVEDSGNPDATPFVIDASGKLVVGYTLPISVGTANTSLQTHGNSSTGLLASRWSADSFSPYLNLGKSRGASVGTNVIVQNNDALGAVQFCGDDGTDLISVGASIQAEVDGTPGTNDMPGRLVFSTTADGASSPTERMRITSTGDVLVGTTVNNANSASDSTVGASIGYANGTVATKSSGGNINLILNRSDGTSGTVASFRTNGSNRGSISVTTTATSYNTSSTSGVTGVDANTLAFETNNAERMRITSTGNVGIGTSSPATTLSVNGGVTISRTAVTAPAASDGNVFSGTYTPTLTNATNVSASTAFVCQYMRVGNVVTVSGRVDIDPTATGVFDLRLSLPVTSSFSASFQAGGTACDDATQASRIAAVASTSLVQIVGTATSTANKSFWFTFTYRIL